MTEGAVIVVKLPPGRHAVLTDRARRAGRALSLYAGELIEAGLAAIAGGSVVVAAAPDDAADLRARLQRLTASLAEHQRSAAAHETERRRLTTELAEARRITRLEPSDESSRQLAIVSASLTDSEAEVRGLRETVARLRGELDDLAKNQITNGASARSAAEPVPMEEAASPLGWVDAARPDHAASSRLTAAQIRTIRNFDWAGMSPAQIARQCDLSVAQVRAALAGRAA